MCVFVGFAMLYGFGFLFPCIYRSVWKERPQHKAKGGERETTEGIDLLSVCIYKRNYTEGVDPLRERETTEGIDHLREWSNHHKGKRNHTEGNDLLRVSKQPQKEGFDHLRERKQPELTI